MNEYDQMPEEPVAAEEPTEAQEPTDKGFEEGSETIAAPQQQAPPQVQPYQAPPQVQPYQAPPQAQPYQAPPQYQPYQAPPQYQPYQGQPQQGNPYQQNYYTGGRPPGDNAATGALVCGIVGLFFAGFILGIIAIVQGNKAKRLGYPGGKATAGIVLGVIALCGWVFAMIMIAAFGMAFY